MFSATVEQWRHALAPMCEAPRLMPGSARDSDAVLEAARNLGLMICDRCGMPMLRSEAVERCPRCARKIPSRYLMQQRKSDR
jgi:rubrerythrin